MCSLCVHVCAQLLESKIVMVELISCFILVSVGYCLGFFMGWGDGRKSSYRERATTPSSLHKKKPLLCQDYSHLKKKAIIEKLSRTSLAHMPDKNVYEKVYDAEVVEDEVRIAKVIYLKYNRINWR